MRLILPLPGDESFARHLAEAGGWELGHLETGRFSEGESNVRIISDVADRQVDFVCTLARPDDSFLRLAFAADADVAVEAGHIVPINDQLLKRGKL